MPLVKLSDSRETTLVGNNNVTVVNQFDGTMPPNVDYSYYVDEAWKVINAVLPNQTRDGEQTMFSFD
jgi:hypothetical protein